MPQKTPTAFHLNNDIPNAIMGLERADWHQDAPKRIECDCKSICVYENAAMNDRPLQYSQFSLELYVRITVLITGWKRLGRWPRIEGDGWLKGKLNEAISCLHP